MSSAKNMVESLREIVQDFLVPELKAMEAMRQEMVLQSINNLSAKLDYTGGVRERLAAVEARLPRQ